MANRHITNYLEGGRLYFFFAPEVLVEERDVDEYVDMPDPEEQLLPWLFELP